MTANSPSKRPSYVRLSALIREAASKLVAEEDVWAKYKIHEVPAERVIRHLYHPATQQWSTDVTIVKIEPSPFTHGAMRFCHRMKKMATPPNHATNHRFHSYGWSRASNYVAKCYHKDGEVDTSEEAKQAIRNDILLQYEAAHWAQQFNESSPTKKIVFLRAYVIEFPDRPGRPLFAVERFIEGKDCYGAGFVKHNTNSGFVDDELHRKTPQVFSAHSFYASHGNRLVADIQGVGDMFTDPQVLSMDYRFGDGDLGPRGMALFFHSFRHCAFSDSMGIPIFPLSRNERKHQAKYDDDEITISDDEQSLYSDLADQMKMDKFARLDLNRQRRKSSLVAPPRDLFGGDEQLVPTERRSNISPITREDVSRSIRNSLRMSKKKPPLSRSVSDVDEVTSCLLLAMSDARFDHRSYHRKASGELRARHYVDQGTGQHRRGTIVKNVAPPIIPDQETKTNLGKVHFHLACLHGMGRFPHIVPPNPVDGTQDAPYDVFSVLFHLCHAASLHNVSACLSLARVKSGLDSAVADLLPTIVPIDFEGAKDLLQRAMHFEESPSHPKAAAGCLLYQILEDEGEATNGRKMQVLEDTLTFFTDAESEAIDLTKRKERIAKGAGFHVGDKVEANYEMEGTYYPGVIEEILGDTIKVKYDDDGSCEVLTSDNVRHHPSMTASLTATSNSGPLSDDEALGFENHDEKPILEGYVLKAELALLKKATGETQKAADLLEEAAQEAVNDGKMQTAAKWSQKALELRGYGSALTPF